jgi:hypothetical protein
MTQMEDFALSPLPFYASTIQVNDKTILLHSWVKRYEAPVACTDTFWQLILKDNNQSLWRTLKCDGDGAWIRQGLLCGSLLVAHDRSYMKEVSTSVCSAAVMIYCTVTKMTYTCTIAEYSDSASSYRGEILGAILTQLILRAAATGQMGPFPILTEDCDNNGVVLHGNNFSRPLSASQKQADVIRVMKNLISQHIIFIKFLYVQSHTDDIKKLSECTNKVLMNIVVDDLAQKALCHAHMSGKFFDGNYPSEDFIVSMWGIKTTSPIRPALETHWGKTEARRFFNFKNIVHTHNFDLIWWVISKQVSGWCGSNSKQSLWDTTISNMCPNCGLA